LATDRSACQTLWKAGTSCPNNSPGAADPIITNTMNQSRVVRSILLLWIILGPASLSLFTGLAGPTRFPGAHDSVLSPDKLFQLRNRDAQDETEISRFGNNHALFLRDMNGGIEIQIHAYGRHIEALWSPDSRFVAITDFVGSDESLCYIFRLSDKKLIALTSALKQAINDRVKLANHHVYYQMIGWQKAGVAKVKVSGYGESNKNGFEISLLYDVVNERASEVHIK
jgi:hypothetical protein